MSTAVTEHDIELSQGMRLHYRQAGNPAPDAPVVIILHGWGCSGSTMAIFETTIAENCPQWKIFNLDLPGFGASTEPPETWGIERYTRALEEFVAKLGIRRPALIGHSFGGRMSILYSSRNETDRVVLVDAAGIKPRRSMRYYFRVYSFKTAKRLLPLVTGRRRAEKIIESWRKKAGSSDYSQASPRMRAILSRCVNEDLRNVMGLIKAPTLLIWGTEDTATPISDARIMLKRIPGAALVEYPGCGHFSFLDNPGQTRAVITSFFNNKV